MKGKTIPEMQAMSREEYKAFLRGNELFFIDHHGILRSSIESFPIACTPEQVDLLIAFLGVFRDEIG